MLTLEQQFAIEGLTNCDNAEEVMQYMTARFAGKHPEKIPELLSINNNLIKVRMELDKEKLGKAENSLHWATCELSHKKKEPIKDKISFITAVNVCKVLFPKGNSDNASEATRKYFESMKKYLFEHKDEYLNSDWAIGFEHNEYFEKLLKES